MHNAQRPELLHYLCWMNWFSQDVEVMSPFMGVFQHVGSPVISRHEQHFAIGKNFADFNCRIYARHSVHYDIADEHIERSSPAPGQSRESRSIRKWH